MRISAAPTGKRPLKGDFVMSLGAKDRVVGVAQFVAAVNMENGDGE
jgi:hypothetical protein